ncbi:MAG TPA: FAD-binding oxidoreductase [Phenylobacterium sp.]|nr:FAD-binding oxidoreductase [Phenylobacterium sp.]
MPTSRLSGWGRYPAANCELNEPSDVEGLVEALSRSGSVIARGAGRSYGDSSLNPAGVLATRRLDRMLAFTDAGVLTCEAGVLLSDVIDVFLPRGWFPPVTPGTKFVTIGGMIASDVHGKNHEAGSFCDHLLSLDLALGDGQVTTCSRNENPQLFEATCGGMGLTGVILRASFRLTPVETARIRQKTIPAGGLDEAMDLLESSQAHTYSVAWIDCLAAGADLGRSVVFLGEHAKLDELPSPARATPFARASRPPLAVPLDLPDFVLSGPSVRAFNALYFHGHGAQEGLVDLEPYFYPLDALRGWNRIYGRRGFVQYQPTLPFAESRVGIRRLLTEIARARAGSFLAVLKRMGPQSFGMLSFPFPGYSLALDFPATPANLALLDRLDAILLEHGGRLYMAKDARMGPAMVEAGYPRVGEFRKLRRQLGLADRFVSLQSQRLEL